MKNSKSSRILFNDFKAEAADLDSEINAAINRVLNSGWYILGKEGEQFESEFAQYLNVKAVIGVANGLEAIQLILLALGISQGDEVITTPLSAVATTLAITAVGATPIFVDIDDHYHLDIGQVEAKINGRTKAVLPVHLYGNPINLSALQAVLKKHPQVHLIEDAAQAHGATYQNKKVGSFGTAAAFSFYPTKNLGCYGDGGAISTNDLQLATKLRQLRNYGQETRYIHLEKGLNSRLDELQAAILRVKLQHLDRWNARRRALAARYTQQLNAVGDLILPMENDHGQSCFHLYVIRTKHRDQLMKYLHDQEIDALIHYPLPIHKQPCYPEFHDLNLPKVDAYSKQILSLPIHPYLSDQDVGIITDLIAQFF